MQGITVVLSLFAILMGLILFAFFPNYVPRLHLNQEGLHALSKQANQELRDGTLARKIIKQEGQRRANAIRAAKDGRPLNSGGGARFKKVPGSE